MTPRIALTLLLLVTVLSGCAIRRPQVGLNRVEVGTVGITGADLNVRLDIHNPNRWAIDLRTLNYELSVDDLPLGAGETQEPFLVPGGGCATLTLPVVVQWPGVGRAGRELLSGEVEYRVQGRLTVQTPIGRISRRFDRTSRFSPLAKRQGGGPLCEPAELSHTERDRDGVDAAAGDMSAVAYIASRQGSHYFESLLGLPHPDGVTTAI